MRASLLWLKQNDVISDSDLELVHRIREHRNALAHNLPKFLTTAEAEIDVTLLGEIQELVTKIDRWWIREVEIPSDSDFDGKEIPENEIFSGTMIVLHLMIQIVGGNNPSEFYEEFLRQMRLRQKPNE